MITACILCKKGIDFEEPVCLMKGEKMADGRDMTYPCHLTCYQSLSPKDLDLLRKTLVMDSDEAATAIQNLIAAWMKIMSESDSTRP